MAILFAAFAAILGMFVFSALGMVLSCAVISPTANLCGIAGPVYGGPLGLIVGAIVGWTIARVVGWRGLVLAVVVGAAIIAAFGFARRTGTEATRAYAATVLPAVIERPLTPDEVAERMRRGADLGGLGPLANDVWGHGWLRAYAAFFGESPTGAPAPVAAPPPSSLLRGGHPGVDDDVDTEAEPGEDSDIDAGLSPSARRGVTAAPGCRPRPSRWSWGSAGGAGPACG